MKIVWLKELKKEDVDIAGYKAAYVAELMNQGYNVPIGFVIVFENVQEYLGDPIKTQRVIQSTEISSEDREKILEAYELLDVTKKTSAADIISGKNPKVAIRSSPVAEVPEKLLHGIHKSYTNVPREDIIEALKACLASNYTSAAVKFREEKGLKVKPLPVLVQKMVRANFSGTATRQSEGIEIEACIGMMHNEAERDKYIVVSGEIVEHKVVKQSKVFDGRKLKEINEDKQKLNDKQIMEIVKHASKAVPMNFFEWIFEGDSLYFVRAGYSESGESLSAPIVNPNLTKDQSFNEQNSESIGDGTVQDNIEQSSAINTHENVNEHTPGAGTKDEEQEAQRNVAYSSFDNSETQTESVSENVAQETVDANLAKAESEPYHEEQSQSFSGQESEDNFSENRHETNEKSEAFEDTRVQLDNKVVMLCGKGRSLEQIRSALEKFGAIVFTNNDYNIHDSRDVKLLFRKVRDYHDKVDMVINCSNFSADEKRFEELAQGDFMEVINSKLVGAYMLSRKAASKGCLMINVVDKLKGKKLKAAHTSASFGVAGLTESIFDEGYPAYCIQSETGREEEVAKKVIEICTKLPEKPTIDL